MENNKGSKTGNFLQKMFRFRVKVDRKGEPIVNVSSIFGLACLIFAPHMTIVGVVAALLLGYQIHFEAEGDTGDFEERIRKAAQNVKSGAMTAVQSIQTEINKARSQNASAQQSRPTAEQVQAAQRKAEEIVQKASETAPSNEELLQDLQAHAQAETVSNPAATTFHSAYAASVGSVPVLKVDETPETPEAGAPAAKGAENR